MANVIDLSEKVRQEIDRLNGELESKWVLIEVEDDAADVMNKNIDQIIVLGLSGALLAIFVLFLFLRKIRIISIVAFAIPISVFSVILFLLSIRNNDQHVNPHGYRPCRRYVTGQFYRRHGEYLPAERSGSFHR